MDKFDNLLGLCNELEQMFEGLFLSGLSAIDEYRINDIKKLSDECEKTGLTYAKDSLKSICDKLDKQRHSMNPNNNEVIENIFKLNTYIKFIRTKLSVLKVQRDIKKGEC